ncbi:MAG: HAD-IA family hydrolase [Burkholderiaceae bacterium]|nr:HAD-IA family hydrolase [Burkholderiaceae bacterium]
MLDVARIRAITLDLDDTLWPIWPTIERAEQALTRWLSEHAPMTSALFANPHARHDIRQQVLRAQPELSHNLSAVRLEAIRLALHRAGDNPSLATEAFEVFFAERQRVTLYEDALPALEWLAQRFRLVALSNGNADLQRMGLARMFKGSINPATCGVGKPDVRIFQAAARCVGVAPANVLHVGDDASLDVLGALGAGMQTVWVNRSEQLWPFDDRAPHEDVCQLGELCDLLA